MSAQPRPLLGPPLVLDTFSHPVQDDMPKYFARNRRWRRVLLKTGPRPSGPRRLSGSAAQRLSGSAAPRPTGPRRPSGPRPATARRPTAHDDPAARSRFSIVFCPVVNPCACTGLHRVWACKMYDGEFEFGYHYNIKQSFRSFHSLHVAT